MAVPDVLRALAKGLHAAPPAQRAAFGAAGSYALAIGVARSCSYGIEQQEKATIGRSLARRFADAPRRGGPTYHHHQLGFALTVLSGAAAIAARADGRELLLSVPFGTGVGLVLDEVGLLLEQDNPFWGTEGLAAAQAATAGLVATALAARFTRAGWTAARTAPG